MQIYSYNQQSNIQFNKKQNGNAEKINNLTAPITSFQNAKSKLFANNYTQISFCALPARAARKKLIEEAAKILTSDSIKSEYSGFMVAKDSNKTLLIIKALRLLGQKKARFKNDIEAYQSLIFKSIHCIRSDRYMIDERDSKAIIDNTFDTLGKIANRQDYEGVFKSLQHAYFGEAYYGHGDSFTPFGSEQFESHGIKKGLSHMISLIELRERRIKIPETTNFLKPYPPPKIIKEIAETNPDLIAQRIETISNKTSNEEFLGLFRSLCKYGKADHSETALQCINKLSKGDLSDLTGELFSFANRVNDPRLVEKFVSREYASTLIKIPDLASENGERLVLRCSHPNPNVANKAFEYIVKTEDIATKQDLLEKVLSHPNLRYKTDMLEEAITELILIAKKTRNSSVLEKYTESNNPVLKMKALEGIMNT